MKNQINMTNQPIAGEYWTRDGQIYSLETGKTFALMTYFDEKNQEQKATAQILAASKDLLEALEALLHDFEEEVQSVDPEIWKMGDEGSWTTNILNARAAIQKARNEQ